MGKLDGKVAIVTGGARGQGRAHAVALASEGADVVICDVAEQIGTVRYPLATTQDLADTAELVDEAGRRCLAVQADVRSQEQMNAVVEQARSEFGRIDILIANAGIASNAPIAEMDEQTWRDMIEVNLTGVFHSFRAVVPHMIEQRSGRIVATSSIAARMGTAKGGHYAAAKWGVLGLVKSLSLEVAQFGITVNAVLPAGVQTDMIMNPATYQLLLPDIDNPTEVDAMAMFEAGGGLIQPEDVAEVILMLVADSGRHFNGEAITISDGLSANTT
ncbi:mycofactocin-coupled SDR family oxidoreductase [Nocardia cyriacigeorgica]|uniref:3-oxoacyl-[acyl-carrier-protein] reductase MabA n=1 Tax=Nocardia cyriacigeorgica TaxID=135487 RepID=A0A6P1D810_9NOCA|nr:mycofactocin-coupled SDR family oxidoreductase [Nocardia cyriacigeorgica]NEW39903.1 mycofactocin-coupled SDR family oxidoreductase [Nocardia cyriacigeorgica]NEW45661.1 mycofactocin-coupled SDR family oxidoreductase [Nocardia cyriacigeorgica]NEW51386.1 mycofactocin-coupled SDR family oxidoreductase [Nocardia cyriacigeorgica]NEW55378.1 mycofactocin-coupled SDR family oxidoreductase [Nocardia cyriacigeorgica]